MTQAVVVYEVYLSESELSRAEIQNHENFQDYNLQNALRENN